MGFSRSLRRGILFGVRLLRVEFELPQLQESELLVVYQKHLLSSRRLPAVFDLLPYRHPAQTYGVIGVLVAKRRQRRYQHFAQFPTLKRRTRAHQGGRPQQIAQSFRRLHFDGGDVLQRQPEVLPGGVDFQLGADPRIRVNEGFERLAVERPGKRRRFPGSSRVLFLLKQLHPAALRVQRAGVQQRSQLSVFAALCQHLQLLFGPVVGSRKTQQFEPKRAALDVARVVPKLRAQRLHGLVELAGLKQLSGSHDVPQWVCGLRRTLRLQVVLRGDRAAQRPVGLLLLVIHLHRGVVEGGLLNGRVAASRLVRGDQDVRKRVLQELLLLLAGLPADQNRALDVLACGTRQNQLRGGLIDGHDEVKVLHGNFTPTATAAGSHRTGVRLAP